MAKECKHCYKENLDTESVCQNCGIAFEPQANESSNNVVCNNATNPTLSLKDMDTSDDKTIDIEGSCMLGKEGDVEPEYFEKFRYISRKHCKIHFEKGNYYVAPHPTSTNPTVLDGNELKRGIKAILRDGQYLTLADRTFEVSINAKTHVGGTGEPSEPSANEEGKTKVYYIICPKCGKEHIVSSLEEKIAECDDCDKYDKKAIAKERAKIRYED
ncbi:MAG: FHA domain-containing protein [Oscillospiraceae bacterium]|nr:FHA domain-containing protein [Oscillospiraceae bacterium]